MNRRAVEVFSIDGGTVAARFAQSGHQRRLVTAFLTLLLTGCGSFGYPMKNDDGMYKKVVLDTPEPDPTALAHADRWTVSRGRYLVEILGCAGCHTDGALLGKPEPGKGLAGSRLGIAYTNPLHVSYPGVADPPNLTPDKATGLGDWSEQQIVTAIRSGASADGTGHLEVMSWPLYQNLTDEDVHAIVTYLRAVPAISNRVPSRVSPGTRASTPYLYFGIFQSGPDLRIHPAGRP